MSQNVDILLEPRANTNGIDLTSLEEYQMMFLGFQPSIPNYIDIDVDVADRKILLRCMKL